MNRHLRIARPVTDLARSVRMYRNGLSLAQIDSFTDHDGFDGVMLGEPGGQFHFEFTFCRHHPIAPAPTPDDLLVFYLPVPNEWEACCQRMRDAGFVEATAFNPYWSHLGVTFEDHDGYRVVIHCSAWANMR